MSETRERRPCPARVGEARQPTARPPPSRRMSRRGFLVLGAAGVATAAAGTFAVRATCPAWCRFPALLEPTPREVFADPVLADYRTCRRARHSRIRVRDLRPAGHLPIDAAFGERLDAWLELHQLHTGERPTRSAPTARGSEAGPAPGTARGQAFDLARLRADGTDLVSLRYDQWRDAPAPELRRRSGLLEGGRRPPPRVRRRPHLSLRRRARQPHPRRHGSVRCRAAEADPAVPSAGPGGAVHVPARVGAHRRRDHG